VFSKFIQSLQYVLNSHRPYILEEVMEQIKIFKFLNYIFHSLFFKWNEKLSRKCLIYLINHEWKEISWYSQNQIQLTKFNSISPNQSFACMYPFRYSPSNKHGSRGLINYLRSFRWRLSLHSNIIFACDLLCFRISTTQLFTDIHLQLP